MATETKKKTTTSATKKSGAGSAAKAGTAGTAKGKSVTVASTAGKKKSTSGAGDKTSRLTRDEQLKLDKLREDKRAAADARRKDFSEQYMPYILGALGILILIFFASFLFSREISPDEYWMGPVGYWFGYFFYGLFGWPAFCIPLLMIYLAIFWRKNCREDTVVFRSVLSVVLMILISGVVHVFACVGNESFAEIDLALLYESGAGLECGGIIGGLLGFLLYHGLKLWGTILVSVLVFPLLIMFLVGVTPAYVGSLIRRQIAASREAKAERDLEEARASIEAHDAPAPTKKRVVKTAVMEDDDPDDFVPARPRRKAATDETVVPRRSKSPKADADIDETTDAPETVRVNVRTGEVMKDEEANPDRLRRDLEEDAAVPAKILRPNFRREEAVPEVPADEPYEDPSEDPVEVPAADAVHVMGNDADEGDRELYIPARRMQKDRRAPKDQRATPKATAAVTDPDVFAVDDLPEDVEHLEISWDDDADEADHGHEVIATAARRVLGDSVGARDESEKIVVVVNRQETAAVTSTTDYHMDGLSDEEIVLPSESEEIPEEEKLEYAFPPIDLLIKGPSRYEADEDEIVRNTQTLRSVLESFHIRVKEIACSCGPTITRYEVKPDTGVRVRSIANLVDDIALGLAKSGVRIEAPIPGKAAVGIEVPNDHAANVALRNLIEAPEFMNHKSRLAACLGADVAGRPVMMDINKMPHLLVAGTTGSGKSVCINSIIMSILYKAKPDEVKLILIDPKKVEFAVYRDLPHLYCPLISDPKKAAGALNSAVVEMERRFELIEEVGVRNIAGYNEATAGDPERPPLPQMVIIIDELADLMMTASNEVETAICRLAQKARAAGIHLILGTQRPSVDVITGLIKANVPSRIAFTVASAVDSRTIIDMVGAEKLIGRGDMLYSPVGSTKPMRVQGAFVSDGEVEKVVSYLKEHNAQTEYDESFMHQIEVEAAKCGQGKKKGGDVGNIEDFGALGGDDEDGKFWAAVEVAVDAEKISTSLLQRRLNLGYGRAAKIIDRMEEMGFVGPADGNKPRKLLITKQDLAEIRISGRADGAADE